MIGTIARFLGLDTLIVYAIIAALAGGGIWAWSAHRYNAGYDAGVSHERQAWEELRKREMAKQAAQKAADQQKINDIEFENLQNEQRADKAEADLEKAIHDDGQSTAPAIPRSISRAINGVR